MPDGNEKLCFVLMPFREDLKGVYTKAIQPACENAGFKALRADELVGPFNIHRDIIEYIFRSDIVIADLTDWNPNVFYEMGVAHAIDNKTIMIIEKGKNVPFDIHNYRCIAYHLTESGLSELTQHLTKYLTFFQEWRKRPTNPVQEFKPLHAFVPHNAWDALNRELQQKEEQLKAAVPRTELEKLQHELHTKEQNTVTKSEWEVLKKQLEIKTAAHDQLQLEIVRLRAQVSLLSSQKSKPVAILQFRAQPLSKLSIDAVQRMLKENNFFDSKQNQNGKSIRHQYEKIEREGQELVLDHTTGLTWQQSGSSHYTSPAGAEEYILDLNSQYFAGYNDWRLPTLEEAMSLMEPKIHNNLYLDPVFDRTQIVIWTADKSSTFSAWYIVFKRGYCTSLILRPFEIYVRGVRR